MKTGSTLAAVILAAAPALAAEPASAVVRLKVTSALQAMTVSQSTDVAAYVSTGASGDTINFSVSGPGYVNPTSVPTDGTGHAVTTYYPGGSTGLATVHATDATDPNHPSGSCQIGVFTLTLSPADIWWFNGETPSGYPTQSTVTATGPSGTYLWTLVSGCGRVTLSDTSVSPLVVTSAVQSAAGNDVAIRFKWNGHTVGTVYLTVLSPDHLHWLYNEDTAHGIGYKSYVHYKIQDQFYVTLGPSVPVNESWMSAHTSDYAGETWPQALTHNGTVNPADWSDSVGAWGTGYYPAPQNPQSPLGNTRVHHWGQQWRVGTLTSGAGKAVQDDVLQYYRDHGRAE